MSSFYQSFLCDEGKEAFVSYFTRMIEQTLGPDAPLAIEREKFDLAAYCVSNKVSNYEMKNIVSDILTYKAFKTNKTYNNKFTPAVIASMFAVAFKDVNISGPISLAICIPNEKLSSVFQRSLPVLILLGDDHKGREECNNVGLESDYSLYDGSFVKALHKFIKYNKIIGDLFIEVWDKKGITMQIDEEKSSLTDTHNFVKWCYGKLKNDACPVPYFRTHYADPRPRSNDCDAVWGFIVSSSSYNDFVKVLYKTYPLEDPANIYKLVCSRLRKGTQKFFESFFTDTDYEDVNRFFTSYSKLWKELKQLPSQFTRYLVSTYNNYLSHLFLDVEGFLLLSDQPINIQPNQDKEKEFQSLKAAVKPYIYSKTSNNEPVSTIYWFGFGSTLDMYFLARAFKSPVGNLPSQLSMLYAGNHHVNHIIHFLTYQTDLYSVHHYSENKAKCVQVLDLQVFSSGLLLDKRLNLQYIYGKIHALLPTFLIKTNGNMSISRRKELTIFLAKHEPILQEVLFFDDEITVGATKRINKKIEQILKQDKDILPYMCRIKQYFLTYFQDSQSFERLLIENVVLEFDWQVELVMQNSHLKEDKKMLVDYLFNYAKPEPSRKCISCGDSVMVPYVLCIAEYALDPDNTHLEVACEKDNVKMIQYVLDLKTTLSDNDIDILDAYFLERPGYTQMYFRRFIGKWKFGNLLVRLKVRSDDLRMLFV